MVSTMRKPTSKQRERFDEICQLAREERLALGDTDEGLPPQLFCFSSSGKVHIISTDFRAATDAEAARQKDVFVSLAQVYMAAEDVYCYAFVFEAWFKKFNFAGKDFKRPPGPVRTMEGRHECIFVLFEDDGGMQMSASMKLNKDGDKLLSIEDPELQPEGGELESRFSKMLLPKAKAAALPQFLKDYARNFIKPAIIKQWKV